MNLLYSLDILALEGYRHDLSVIKSAEDIPESQHGLLPALTSLKVRKSNQEVSFRVIKTHNLPEQQRFCKTIYLYRDGRDAVWSYYHYQRRFNAFGGTFGEFLKSPERPAGAWAKHVRQWLSAGDRIPFLQLKYEDLLSNPAVEIRRLLGFLSVQRSDAEISSAVRNCDFAALRTKERSKIGAKKDENLYFFRRGQSGEWRKAYTAEHITAFRTDAYEVLNLLGYEPL
jgi:hypothetical protein